MKRFLSIIIALIMLVSLSAVSAFAAVTDASVESADGSTLQIWDDIGYITGVTPKTSQSLTKFARLGITTSVSYFEIVRWVTPIFSAS